jgi:hypothetical protein
LPVSSLSRSSGQAFHLSPLTSHLSRPNTPHPGRSQNGADCGFDIALASSRLLLALNPVMSGLDAGQLNGAAY